MESRILEITLHYAKDLNKVNLFTKTEAYAVVSLSGNNNWNQKTKTPTDHHGDANPTWNFPMKFTLDEAALHHNLLTLNFRIVCQRVLGDKDIGEVHVSVKELFDSLKNNGGKSFITYQVRKPSGKSKGQLTFSYQFREKVVPTSPLQPYTAVSETQPCGHYYAGPMSAHPAAGPGPSVEYQSYPVVEGGGYFPPATGYYPHVHGVGTGPVAGYPPPSQYGYSYSMTSPHLGYGYGHGNSTPLHAGYSNYPPTAMQHVSNKKSEWNIGLGAGLLGGAIGGLLIGDMVGDGFGGF